MVLCLGLIPLDFLILLKAFLFEPQIETSECNHGVHERFTSEGHGYPMHRKGIFVVSFAIDARNACRDMLGQNLSRVSFMLLARGLYGLVITYSGAVALAC